MNHSLTSLVNDVFTLTNRPDLVGETTLAVRNATLKAHKSDYYYKDLFETGITFDFAQTQQSLEYKQLIPRWRALKYIRKYSAGPGSFLEIITPEQVLDSYSATRENVCYVAGQEIKIRSLDACQNFLLGCYVHPDVTTDNYCSWIAEEQPAAIVYEAVATIFKTIGYDEQFVAYRDMAKTEIDSLRNSNIIAVAY
jgi:hypothetical protein